MAPLELKWIQEIHNVPQVEHPRANKLLQKLFSVNITELEQITLTPATQLMNHNDYKHFMAPPQSLLSMR